jgi:hypothetical protein
MLPFGITILACIRVRFIMVYKICIVGNIAGSNVGGYFANLKTK